MAASQPDAGGSHGGTGGLGNDGGAPGAIYGSVYEPLLGGGGGSQESWAAGGAAATAAAWSTSRPASSSSTARSWRAASRVSTPALAARAAACWCTPACCMAPGSIDASGGDHKSQWQDGGGGGGRVALYIGDATGFDPLAQVRAWGGSRALDHGPVLAYAAPGTILVKTGSQVYGRFILDAGQAAGVDRNGPATELPALGNGAVAALQAAGADAWLSGAAPFGVQWSGVWVTLSNTAGAELGRFRVQRIDAQGRLLLAGAGTVAGAGTAASYRGEYRFDSVETLHGAGLAAHDPVRGDEVVFRGDAPVTGEIHAANVTVKEGAVVRPQGTSLLRLVVSGKLTVETGARIDATATGYAGGYAPLPGCRGSRRPASRRRSRTPAAATAGPAGAATTAARRARSTAASTCLSSAAAAARRRPGAAAGAAATAAAWSISRSASWCSTARSGRAASRASTPAPAARGGSVLVHADLLHGAGLIDASGGDHKSQWQDGGGGGGRVALYIGDATGFDPLAQVVHGAARGPWTPGRCSPTRRQGPSSSRTGSQVYGKLILDAGQAAGVDRNGPATELPALGTGTVTAVDGGGRRCLGDRQPGLRSAVGGSVGGPGERCGDRPRDVRGEAVDAQGRALLAGAGGGPERPHTAASTASTRWRRHGAGLLAHDPVTGSEVVFQGDVPVTGEIHATNVTVKEGAVVRPQGTSLLRFVVSGKLTVEAGGRIDATATGYAGGYSFGEPGAGPGAGRDHGVAAGRRRQPRRHRRSRQRCRLPGRGLRQRLHAAPGRRRRLAGVLGPRTARRQRRRRGRPRRSASWCSTARSGRAASRASTPVPAAPAAACWCTPICCTAPA